METRLYLRSISSFCIHGAHCNVCAHMLLCMRHMWITETVNPGGQHWLVVQTLLSSITHSVSSSSLSLAPPHIDAMQPICINYVFLFSSNGCIWVTLPKTGPKCHMESEKSIMGIFNIFLVAIESWFYPDYVYVK